MRSLLRLAAAILMLACPALADAAEDVPVATASTRSDLFVELVVNGRASGTLAAMTQVGDRLAVDAAALRSAGIAVTGAGMRDLAHLQGVRAAYDASGQRLLLDVDPALLPTRRISADPAAQIAPVIDTGAVLNYDVFAQVAGGTARVAVSNEQRVFGRFGTVSNSGVLSFGGRSSATGGDTRHGYVRLDTRYQWVDERRSIALTAGDLITRSLSWTRAVRLGGIELSRNFALRPDLITVPLPSFAGEAAVPTGVDLFINGYRQSRAEVEPGRFVLDSVPVVNGAGEARIVTTDAVGRQIATVIPFYVAPDLLRPGLTDFAVSAGALRRGYGLTSFAYGRPAASASLRRGITPRLTLSAHGEATRGLAGAGIGAVWSPGLWGAVNGAFAVSNARGSTGTQTILGYAYTGRRLSLGAEHVARSVGYRDIGSFDLARFAGSRRSDRVTVSMPLPGIGSVGAGYVASRFVDGARARLASASLSVPVGRRASAFFAADYDLDRHAVSAQLRLILPFGGSGAAAIGAARDGSGGMRVQAGVARTARPAGGIGYAVDIARAADGTMPGQASATWQSARIQLEAGAATTGRTGSGWLGASGAVVLLDGQTFAARALPGAFAVVSTGTPHVPVFYENQPMGQTDRHGRLFVPNVVAWHPGRFAIDAIDLDTGLVADRTEARAAMRAGTGGVVRLPVRFHNSVTARLVDTAGAALPPGTIVHLGDSDATTVVGWDGIVLVEGEGAAVAITAVTAAGPCHATVPLPSARTLMPDIGVVVCH